MKPIFNEEQQKKAAFILESPLSKLSELYSNEIKDLAVRIRQEPHKEPPKRLIARCFGGLFIS